ncbi:hypothetical protein PVAP13_7NG338324 [Panicum virgatum]|uniref:Uncharacterized protein n=1 Tax=Panicum virgatum TaxID=38727 RepID=A0A8T0Q161_PANVG|nr:hypothetical protein PVAP13_7NG338324 [Panicum virgatum]
MHLPPPTSPRPAPTSPRRPSPPHCSPRRPSPPPRSPRRRPSRRCGSSHRARQSSPAPSHPRARLVPPLALDSPPRLPAQHPPRLPHPRARLLPPSILACTPSGLHLSVAPSHLLTMGSHPPPIPRFPKSLWPEPHLEATSLPSPRPVGLIISNLYTDLKSILYYFPMRVTFQPLTFQK